MPSHLKESKIKICKCGHLKDDHKSNPKSKFSLTNDCHKCKCSKYLNRKLPGKFGIVMFFYGLICSSLLLGITIVPMIFFSEEMQKSIKMTGYSLFLLLFCISLIASIMILSVTTFDYLDQKKRKEYPIESKGDLT